jgi:hypothetical protein
MYTFSLDYVFQNRFILTYVFCTPVRNQSSENQMLMTHDLLLTKAHQRHDVEVFLFYKNLSCALIERSIFDYPIPTNILYTYPNFSVGVRCWNFFLCCQDTQVLMKM